MWRNMAGSRSIIFCEHLSEPVLAHKRTDNEVENSACGILLTDQHDDNDADQKRNQDAEKDPESLKELIYSFYLFQNSSPVSSGDMLLTPSMYSPSVSAVSAFTS